jgi:hypothetical protein
VGANLFIDAGNVSRSIIEAYIYNLAGNLVKQAKVTDNTGIDVSNLLTQNYIIVLKDVKTDKQLAVSKFLKE